MCWNGILLKIRFVELELLFNFSSLWFLPLEIDTQGSKDLWEYEIIIGVRKSGGINLRKIMRELFHKEIN